MSTRDSPLSERSRSSSSPKALSTGTIKASGAPRVEVGAPCLRCGKDCEGLLLHVWRKTCINCHCPRDIHKASVESDQIITVPKDNKRNEVDLKDYVWFPKGINLDVVMQYMNSLPDEYVPLRDTKGERMRNKLYLEQLPRHDVDPTVCHDMTDTEKKRLVKIAEKWKTKACGAGTVVTANDSKTCIDCNQRIASGEVCIIASKAPSAAWHPSCFKCSTCRDLLVDLIYFFSEENRRVYCGRHYAELKVPRCFGCDELIVADTFTQAEDKMWHKEHFCCEKCDKVLHRKKYQRKGGCILCQECYDGLADDCHRCRLPIKLGSKMITKYNLSFHIDCFTCKRCRESLSDHDKVHYFAEDDVLCDECMQPVAQCFSCKDGILPLEKHLKHESRTWHVQCFCCSSCKKSLVGTGFHDYAGSLMCSDCYALKVSKKCHACQNAIIGQGVQYGFSMFHPDCFRCSSCKKQLIQASRAGEKISEKDGSFLCESCSLKFAKVCAACKEPITSRHTVYKRKQYHLACFKCTQCGISIGKQSFYETSLNDVLCEPCAGKNI